MPPQIIALSGPRACGKSTIAGYLVVNHGYKRVAFADALREIAKVAGSDFINDRLYLARLGETLRAQVPDFLLQAVKNRLESIEGRVVIEDIRFPEEVEFCQSIGAITIRFEISREEQLRRLENRDGKSSDDAEQLIDCIDENLLGQTGGWDLNLVAEGDFKELAQNLHQLCENPSSPLGTSYVLTQDSMEAQEVV
jgi:dephospho-CoA kinase